MEEMIEKFKENYEFFYEHDKPALIRRLAENFDEMAKKKDTEFYRTLERFNQARQDYVSSDREAAAYMLTWTQMKTY